MAKLKYIVIHCTATEAGREVSAADIRRWHTSQLPVGRGWRQVGYTDMIHIDGSVERLVANNEDDTVDPWEITNGVAGQNSVSRHVVYVGGLRGGKPCDTRSVAQKNALAKYVQDIISKCPDVKVAGHNDFAKKACPCFDTAQWAQEIGINPKNIY